MPKSIKFMKTPMMVGDGFALQNKNVIITGSNKGIGKDMALSFASLGANVVITGRDETALASTLDELKKINVNCFSIRCDMQNVTNIYDMVDVAHSYLGSIDILINNAGINIAKPAFEVTESDWDQVLETNAKGTFFVSQRAALYMKNNKKSKIINIASQMAFVGYINRAAYCASKGALVQLTKALAIEWAPYNILVNAIAPTFIHTELTSKMFEDEEFRQDVLQRIPLGKLASPQDVTGAAIFLASDLSNFITGETIRVDGGWTAI